MKDIPLKITLCYQYNSEHYSKLDLLDCVTKSIEIVNKDLETFSLSFDEIEEGSSGVNMHQNIHTIIEESHLVIFEISDLNKNVLYELGLVKGLKKKFLLLREEGVKEKLPFDIAPFQYMSYNKNDLLNFKNRLGAKIKRVLSTFKPEDIFSENSINRLLSNYFQVINSNDDVEKQFDQLLDKTKLNFYYIGTIGFLTNTNNIDWIEKLVAKNPKPNIYRIVFLQNLKEVYKVYQNSEILENYCKWLAKYYIHVKLNNIKLFDCPDVGIWKAGMSIIISDENELIILTGNFEEFNTKGIWIKHDEIGYNFKEYSKVLAVAYSKKINHLDMIKYFNVGDKQSALDFLESLPKTVEDEEIEALCSSYIERSFLDNNL
ncbi:hypothetical protein ACJD0Z_02125 [Flavobacteriaceae bacterium M23B6Z8]